MPNLKMNKNLKECFRSKVVSKCLGWNFTTETETSEIVNPGGWNEVDGYMMDAMGIKTRMTSPE